MCLRKYSYYLKVVNISYFAEFQCLVNTLLVNVRIHDIKLNLNGYFCTKKDDVI